MFETLGTLLLLNVHTLSFSSFPLEAGKQKEAKHRKTGKGDKPGRDDPSKDRKTSAAADARKRAGQKLGEEDQGEDETMSDLDEMEEEGVEMSELDKTRARDIRELREAITCFSKMSDMEHNRKMLKDMKEQLAKLPSPCPHRSAADQMMLNRDKVNQL